MTMLIEGPFKICIVEKRDSLSRECHLDFTEQFRKLEARDQEAALKRYLAELHTKILSAEEGSPDRQGMLIVQQVTEQLLPHIAAGEIPLTETITVEIQTDSPLARFIPVQTTIN